MQELNLQQQEAVSGGILPVIVYVGAIALGAAIGAGIAAVQGYKAAHDAAS